MAILDPRNGKFVLITTFTIKPSRAEELLAVLSDATENGMRQRPSFVSANLHLSCDKRQIANYAQWCSQADFDPMMSDPAAQTHMKRAADIAIEFRPIFNELRETRGSEAT